MIRFIFLVLFCSLLGACSTYETLQPTGRIPTLAWHGPPESEATPERYAELAAAGFTRNFSHFSSNDAMASALDVAAETNLKLLISTPELQSDPEGTVRRFMTHPANGGYYLRDEPSAELFAELADWARRILAVDVAHPCYINLFPTYASAKQLGTATYQAHVDRYASEVPVPFISFDHYPILGETLRADFYENLEIISSKAREVGKPFWAFGMSVAIDPAYPRAKREHLRLELYSALAYGAQVLQYFTYWTPPSGGEKFNQGPIELDGRKTVVYHRVRAMNDEIRRIAPVFTGAKVLSVGHTGEIPRGTRAYAPVGPNIDIKTSGAGALVSHMENKGRQYLVIVNRDFLKPMQLWTKWDEAAKMYRVNKSGEVHPIRRDSEYAVIAPGDVRILTWRAPR